MKPLWAGLVCLACGSPPSAPDTADTTFAAFDAEVVDAAPETGGSDVSHADVSLFCDLDCDDHNPCTDDVCYVKIGCTHIPHSGTCDDGNACTTGDFCTGDTCAGQPLSCDDGNACTDDSCALPGSCTHTSHC